MAKTMNKELIRNINKELQDPQMDEAVARGLINNLIYIKKSGEVTTDRVIFDIVVQLLDIWKCISEGKYYKIPYEMSDIMSIAVVGQAQFGKPSAIHSERCEDNYKKDMGEVAEKYNGKFNAMNTDVFNALSELTERFKARKLL